MNIPEIPIANQNRWYVKEYDLGLILTGQTADFDLSLVNTCLVQELKLLGSTAGLFNLTIYSRQARSAQDINVYPVDSSETNIITVESIRHNDFDTQNKIYITVGNLSPADINFSLVVKYV